MNNRIRELRRDKDLTMKELGALLGVSESAISQYENGKRQPDNETLLRLSEIFDETVGCILGAEERKPAAPSSPEAEKAPDGRADERFKKFYDLSERDQKAVESLIDSLLSSQDTD